MNLCGKTSAECESLGALLVDYADGATCKADSIRVERHLAECGACRTELAALRRSLCVLESVWAESYVLPVAPHARPLPVRRWRLAAAVGGVAAAVTLAIGAYQAQRPAADSVPVMTNADAGNAANDQVADIDAAIDVDDLDIEAFIGRHEQSARLAASAQILTSLPVDREDAERAQRYLRDAYGVEKVCPQRGRIDKL